MIKITLVCLMVVAAYAHPAHRHGYGYEAPRLYYAPAVKVEKVERAEPYEFSYEIKDEYHNSQGRQESGDAYGNMKGAYNIQLANGLYRWVEYVADDAGFRATVRTNEPGTDSQNPADVVMDATPVEVKEEPKKIVKKIIVAPSYGYYSAPTYGYGPHHGY